MSVREIALVEAEEGTFVIRVAWARSRVRIAVTQRHEKG